MGIWLDGIRDTLKGASSATLGWVKSGIVLSLILLLIWAIVAIYNFIFGVWQTSKHNKKRETSTVDEGFKLLSIIADNTFVKSVELRQILRCMLFFADIFDFGEVQMFCLIELPRNIILDKNGVSVYNSICVTKKTSTKLDKIIQDL